MLEIERIVQAKLDNGQRVEDLERDFDKLVLECLPALVTRNRRAEPPCAHRMLRLMKSTEWTPVSCLSSGKSFTVTDVCRGGVQDGQGENVRESLKLTLTG